MDLSLRSSATLSDLKFAGIQYGVESKYRKCFDDSSLMATVLGVWNIEVGPKIFPAAFDHGAFCTLQVQHGSDQILRTLLYTSHNVHTSPRDQFPNCRDKRKLFLEKANYWTEESQQYETKVASGISASTVILVFYYMYVGGCVHAPKDTLELLNTLEFQI